MVGWLHRLNGHEFEQAPGDGEGQGNLVFCSPWGHKESDMTEQLKNRACLLCTPLWNWTPNPLIINKTLWLSGSQAAAAAFWSSPTQSLSTVLLGNVTQTQSPLGFPCPQKFLCTCLFPEGGLTCQPAKASPEQHVWVLRTPHGHIYFLDETPNTWTSLQWQKNIFKVLRKKQTS